MRVVSLASQALATVIKGKHQVAAMGCPADRTQIKALAAAVKDNHQAAMEGSLMEREVVRAERASHQTAARGSLVRETVKMDRASHQMTETARRLINLVGKSRAETIKTNHPMVSQSWTNRREMVKSSNS